MNTLSRPKLAGKQCLCGACGLAFTTVSAFDAHRSGPYSARRCLTAQELRALGHSPNARGFWRKPMTEEQRARLPTRG